MPVPDRDPGPVRPQPPVAPTPREVQTVPVASPFFNGKDFAGWRLARDGRWTVKDGGIVGFRAPNDYAVGLTSEKAFKDFELKFQYRRASAEPGTFLLAFRNPRGLRLNFNLKSAVLSGGVDGYGMVRACGRTTSTT